VSGSIQRPDIFVVASSMAGERERASIDTITDDYQFSSLFDSDMLINYLWEDHLTDEDN
jgi:hypothetical protein